jgi:hypothetical protein
VLKWPACGDDLDEFAEDVFTGDWLSYEHDRGTRYEAAYAGWLLDRWHG